MKLLLTSEGFQNPKLGEKFVELVGKPPSDITIFMYVLLMMRRSHG